MYLKSAQCFSISISCNIYSHFPTLPGQHNCSCLAFPEFGSCICRGTFGFLLRGSSCLTYIWYLQSTGVGSLALCIQLKLFFVDCSVSATWRWECLCLWYSPLQEKCPNYPNRWLGPRQAGVHCSLCSTTGWSKALLSEGQQKKNWSC